MQPRHLSIKKSQEVWTSNFNIKHGGTGHLEPYRIVEDQVTKRMKCAMSTWSSRTASQHYRLAPAKSMVKMSALSMQLLDSQRNMFHQESSSGISWASASVDPAISGLRQCLSLAAEGLDIRSRAVLQCKADICSGEPACKRRGRSRP